MKQKSEIISELIHDIPNIESVKTVMIQDTIWDNMVEVRCFCADGKTYAALYAGDDKASSFAVVNIKQENK